MTDAVGLDQGGASAGIVHQDRLVLVGTAAYPDILLASRTGDWNDFRLGQWSWEDEEGTAHTEEAVDPKVRPKDAPASATFAASPADGFYATRSSSRGNHYHALIKQEGLFVFGTSGESVVHPGPFTGGELEIRENSWFGSAMGYEPFIAGGLVVFVQAGGKDLRSIAWNEGQRKYNSQSMLVLCGRIFEDAVDIAVQRSTDGRGDLVYLVDDEEIERLVRPRERVVEPPLAEGEVRVTPAPQPRPYSRIAVMTVNTDQASPATFVEGSTFHRWNWAHWYIPEGKVRAVESVLGETALLVERDGELRLEVPDETVPQADGVRVLPGEDLPAIGDPRWRGVWKWNRGQVPTEQGLLDETDGYWTRVDEDSVPPADQRPNDEYWVGRSWSMWLETLPFVVPKGTGLQTRVRRVRALTVSLDVYRAERYSRDPDATREMLLEEQQRMSQIELSLVGSLAGRERNKVARHRRFHPDTDEIRRLTWRGLRGWRDRLALRFECPERTKVVGLAYRVVA